MDNIEELLTRGVDNIYPDKAALEKILRSGKKIKLYQGFDPTGTQLHIGHMVGLRKLSQWQKLGHHVIFLIGDGTGQAGDPSGKTTARDVFLTQDELRQNAKDYVMQAKKIIDFDAPNVEILYNGDWLNKLSLVDILNIMDHLSVQQLVERDLFQERMKSGGILKLREFVYPLLQGYDSVEMEVDLEIGGTDQLFNMLVGRELLKKMKNKDKFVLTTPLLTDSQGKKIGKTEGNVIALTDKPTELFRKIMALGDDVIVKGLEYLTDLPMEEIKEIENKMQSGSNPVEFKKKLAYEVVKQLSSVEEARKAQGEFARVVQNKELPKEVETAEVDKDRPLDANLLVELGLCNSKSDAKRMFDQNAVELDGNKLKSGETMIDEEGEGLLLRVGKKYLRIKVI